MKLRSLELRQARVFCVRKALIQGWRGDLLSSSMELRFPIVSRQGGIITPRQMRQEVRAASLAAASAAFRRCAPAGELHQLVRSPILVTGELQELQFASGCFASA